MPKLSGVMQLSQEVLRVETPYTLLTNEDQLHILDVYCIPRCGFTPPIPSAPENEGSIRIQVGGKIVFQSAVIALMDSYWRFANEILMDPLGKARELSEILDQITRRHGTVVGEVVGSQFRTRHPGRDVRVSVPSYRRVRIERVDSDGNQLDPVELQLQCLRREPVQ